MSQIPEISQSTVVSSPTSSNAITAGAVASANGGAEATSNTRINSLGDLKKRAPKLYNMMMLGIATGICSEMQHHQEKLKKLMREGQRQT